MFEIVATINLLLSKSLAFGFLKKYRGFFYFSISTLET